MERADRSTLELPRGGYFFKEAVDKSRFKIIVIYIIFSVVHTNLKMIFIYSHLSFFICTKLSKSSNNEIDIQ